MAKHGETLEKELERLSAEATPGPWYQGDIVEGQLIGQWQEIGPTDDPCRLYAFMAVDANFIVALVNAYRAGTLLPKDGTP